MDLMDIDGESSSNTITIRIAELLNKVRIVRRELNNIRKYLRHLNSSYQKSVDNVLTTLKTWTCGSCSSVSEFEANFSLESIIKNPVSLQPIGLVSTSFAEKRGTPRQSVICVKSRGKVTLFDTLFTNPNHALAGLQEFSHMWILFHFHKIDTIHVRAKVAPPRLNGLKTGVFATRSPHRPSPIGLSLVHIDYIEASSIYFSGVDMLDGTPVMDVKPYIPQNDNPIILTNQWNNEINLSKVLYGSELIDEGGILREAPDGKEKCGSESRVPTSARNISTNK